MISEYDKDLDPNKTVTLLHAIRWTVYAWENFVKPATIYNCWQKSTLLGKCNLEGPRLEALNEDRIIERYAEDLVEDVDVDEFDQEVIKTIKYKEALEAGRIR
jgi:hypothetical protein